MDNIIERIDQIIQIMPINQFHISSISIIMKNWNSTVSSKTTGTSHTSILKSCF